MQYLIYTVVGIVLYVISDALLDRLERRRGQRFEQRSLIFFAIIAVLAILTFQLIELLQR